MKLFRRKTTKLEERIASLENRLGVGYVLRDGYSEHITDEYGEVPTLKRDVKELQNQKKGRK